MTRPVTEADRAVQRMSDSIVDVLAGALPADTPPAVLHGMARACYHAGDRLKAMAERAPEDRRTEDANDKD